MSTLSDEEAYEALAARFRPVFARIAEGAVDRELHRDLAHEPVAWLKEAGFGAVRVPVEFGGSGASVSQLFRLLIELGEADSNLPQILRAHFGLLEERLHDPDTAARERWLKRIGAGAVIGNATTEVGGGALGAVATELTGDGPTLTLRGTKHYSTGSLYADWIAVLARRGEEEQGFALVPADAQGVTRIDDWDGFGQRLTASGTTVLDGVEVDPDDVFWFADRGPSYMIAFYQLFHLAALSGIGRAVVRDAVAYVRGRERVFSHGSGTSPAADPLVQQVVGRLSALAFSAEATTLAAVAGLESINARRAVGEVPQEAYDAAEIAASQAHITVADTVLRAANLLFETGGASTVQRGRALDRHWRNARTLAVHNPVIYKERVVGDHLVNQAAPAYSWIVGVKK
ncbi:acyl-CoA dehydrogenase family protein [Actinocorallia sp. A-T 12471]|uniref:acyl-CoA dehydrogenase family protein n=1 Tax=Actinocorallia sp. A-T 12471 TaxID=3089813 RepID=UPI0029CC7768|nr:acyl-CoA dehydrogenase family protein [Actinocorallia sp. A-T 12471]MDX6742314.1 acyl-CoA dehydrogenase family protein [Actinocorallia sp. A-T 12471]